MSESQPSSARAWSTTVMLFVLATVSILDRNIVTLLIDPIKTHYDLNDAQIGLLIGAAFAIPFGLFVIPFGWAVDRFQRRYIIASGVGVWSLATVATGLAGNFASLVVARAFVGASDASLGPATASWLSDLFPKDRLAFPMAMTNLGYIFGQGAALIVGAALAAVFAADLEFHLPVLGALKGWQLIFLIVGLPGLLLVPVVLSLKEPSRGVAGQDSADDTDFRGFLSNIKRQKRFIIPHHIGFFALVAMSAVMLSWTPAYFTRVHGWSEAVTGKWLGSAIVIGPLLGLPLHGALADYFFRRGWRDIHLRYTIITMLIGTPLMISVFTVGSPELAVVLLGVFWFVVSAYTSLPLTALVSVTPARLRGKAISVVGLVGGTSGLATGPLIVGVLTDTVFHDPNLIGYSILGAIALFLPVFMLGFFLALRPLRELNGQLPT